VVSVKIPREIRQFVARFLPGLEYLETFMLLCNGATRSWSASDIAKAAGLPESVAADVLEHLASDNFLDVKISNDILYRFNPATPALGDLSRRCADFCVRERIAMISLVTTDVMSPMHDFAEAFRLKKGKRNG
jgi:hypothetical protein